MVINESNDPNAGRSKPESFRAYVDSLRLPPFERGARPRDHLYATELGKCARQVWRIWRDPDYTRDEAFSANRGALGHAVEDEMARQLAPVLIAREVKFVSNHCSGRVDFVVRERRDTPQLPVELKTSYARFPDCLASPFPAHVVQLQWYLTQMPEARFGLLIYYSLRTETAGQWDAVRVRPAPDFIADRISRLQRVLRLPSAPKCEWPGSCFDCRIAAEGARQP